MCLQNGTWTPVTLMCVRDPSVPDPVGSFGGSAGAGIGLSGERMSAGVLVGPNGVVTTKDGWTMLMVSVVVAVILGTAVAFLILFVRRWYVL